MGERKMETDYDALTELPGAFELLGKGDQARLRRVKKPEELREVDAFFRLCANAGLMERHLVKMERVLFFIPWVYPFEGLRLGAALENSKVDERRLFQVLRSESPNDLVYLRRAIQMAASKHKTKKLAFDWKSASTLLFFWGESNKKNILHDYYRKRHSKDTEKNTLEEMSNDDTVNPE